MAVYRCLNLKRYRPLPCIEADAKLDVFVESTHNVPKVLEYVRLCMICAYALLPSASMYVIVTVVQYRGLNVRYLLVP